MEVKGIGQKIPKIEQEIKISSRFEEVFDESRKKVDEAITSNQLIGAAVKKNDISLSETIKSPYIDNNPLFISLKEWIETFKKELDNSEIERVPHYHLKMALYESIKKLLREIVLTADRTLQMNYLQRVYDWFLKRRKGNYKFGHKEMGFAHEKPVVVKKYTIEFPAKKFYEEKMRTLHPEIPPPKDRLGDFNRKTVKEAFEEKPNPEGKKEDNVQIPYPPFVAQKPAFVPPQRETQKAIESKSHFLYYQPIDPEEQKMEQMWFERKNKIVAEKRQAEEQEEVLNRWGNSKSRVNESMTRKYENINYGNNFVIRKAPYATHKRSSTMGNKQELNYKKIYDDASSEDEKETETTTPLGIARKTRKKKPHVTDLRKNNVQSLNTSNVFYDGDKRKVESIRKAYGKLIEATEDKMDAASNIFINGPKGIQTLSLYNNNVKRPYTNGPRGKSQGRRVPVTHAGSREGYRMQQMNEITRIKEHLAKEDISCSIIALQRAILIPEDYPACRMSAENFARPGSNLLVNPFAVKKSKKGKKKKSKK